MTATPQLPDSPDPALPDLFLRPGADRRPAEGHPWIYSNELRLDAAAKALAPGSAVRVRRSDGRALGLGTFNAHSLIAVRLFEAARHPFDPAFLADRLERARALRDRLFQAPCYRLIHAEADGLPGLIIDRFDSVVVVQPNTAGADRHLPEVLAALDRAVRPETIVVRADSAARTLEGLASRVEIARGRVDGLVTVTEESGRYLADPLGGQKTGWYFDQRDNRSFAQRLAAGARVLDLFCHTGSFAIAAALAGARTTLGIDGSAAALEIAAESARRAGVDDRARWQRADVFSALDALEAEKAVFDLVIADPPAFVKSRKDLKAGLKGYRKLARKAAGRVAPGGFLIIASCSHNVDGAAFAAEVARGLHRADRRGRILRAAGAGADHPVHPHLPESAYLKSLALALD